MHPESPEHGRVPGESTGPEAEDATRPGIPVPGSPPADEAGPGAGNGRPPGAFRRGRARFRAWRRSRPFWGGLLLILAGLELLLIPIASLVVHGAIKIVIYIGIGGVFGVIFGCILVACGLLSWFHPVQRVFYAIVGALLALGSFVVTNLGGFFLGMLLGVIGASLVFAWTPIGSQPGRGRRRRHRGRRPAEPSGGLDSVLGEPPAGQSPGGSSLLVLPVVPLLLSGLLAAGQAPALSGPPATAPQDNCTSIIPCSPSPARSPAAGPASPMPAASPSASPSPSASRSPSPSASPPPSPAPSASPSPSPSAKATPSPSPSRNPNAGKRASTSAALVAASVPASLTAGSALMTGLSYDGVANVPTANGSQAMLKFSMSSLSLSGGIVLTVNESGRTMVTRNSSIDFSGSVVLYATRLCGDLLGIRLCFSPQKPPPLVLPVMTFTNVATDQPLTTAGVAQAAGLDITGH